MKSSENTILVGACAAAGAGAPEMRAAPHIAPTIDPLHLPIARSLAPHAAPASCHQRKRPVNRFSKIYLLVETISDIPGSASARAHVLPEAPLPPSPALATTEKEPTLNASVLRQMR